MIATILQAIGLRGFIGALAGAVLISGPTYLAGQWREGARCDLRITAALQSQLIEFRENEDDVVRRAMEARRNAERNADAGGMPDDEASGTFD